MIGRAKSGAEPACTSAANRLLGSAWILAPAIAAVVALSIPASVHPAVAAEVNAHGAPHPVGFADIAAKVKSAVIGVRVKVENAESQLPDQDLPFPPGSPFYKFFGTPDQNPQKRRFGTALGSGFFVSSDGYAVTNNHVVENGRNFEITTDDGKTYAAKVIGTETVASPPVSDRPPVKRTALPARV